MPRLKLLGPALLSGALLALCLPKPGLCFLGWFALVPLFYACGPGLPPRRMAGLGFAAGFAFHATALHWIYQTCRFAGVHPAVSSLALVLLSALLALNWAAAALLAERLCRGRSRAWRPWLWALAWTAVAVATERWTPRFLADLLAYTQYRHLSLIQIGAVAGPHALGFLIAAFNAALAEVWRERKGMQRSLAAALALLAGVFLYGQAQMTLRTLHPSAPPPSRVELLQPSIDQYRKWDERFEGEILQRYAELSAQPRGEPAALTVWPESALPMLVEEGAPLPLISELAKKYGAWQLAGAVSRGEEDKIYSAAFLVDPAGRTRGVYRKRQLVPFGEFQPFPWLRRFIGALNALGDAEPGARDQPLFATPLGPAAPSICYEATFPRWARHDVGRGARLIVNVTNDGWYKDTWAPYQHFYANVFRAVETRTPVIRSGNNGISGVIDPWGVVGERLDLNLRGRLDAPFSSEDRFPRGSFYSRHGDWFGLAALTLALVLSFI